MDKEMKVKEGKRKKKRWRERKGWRGSRRKDEKMRSGKT